MPTYEVFINGKPIMVEIAKTGETTFTATLEEKTFNAEFPEGKVKFGKSFQIKVNDKAYAIALEEVSRAKPFTVKVEEASFKVELKAPAWKQVLTVTEQPHLVPTLKGAKPKQIISGTVTAPMTGKILAIKVKRGEQVKTGQVLCILEAMKMENEITAPTAGTIREVLVSEGASVNEGDPLFVIG
jgi:biotin carboxyl carrier protein